MKMWPRVIILSLFKYFTGRSCGNPESVPFAVIEGSDHLFRDEVFYRCIAGYRLDGDAIRSCEADGGWSGSPPTCNRKSFFINRQN